MSRIRAFDIRPQPNIKTFSHSISGWSPSRIRDWIIAITSKLLNFNAAIDNKVGIFLNYMTIKLIKVQQIVYFLYRHRLVYLIEN